MELEHADFKREKTKLAPHPERLGSFAIEKPPADRKPERIGHVLVTTEPGPERVSARRIETMNREQLLKLSEEIILDGSSMRQIYETHLIGERGLRHLVAEYMRDGDLKLALRQEILERERDFERDPALRHLADDDGPLQSKVTLEELLSKADMTADQQREETAFFKARARFEAEELLQHKQRRRVVDITLAAIISILLLLIILLFVSRR